MGLISIANLLDRVNVHLLLPVEVLDIQIANPFLLSDEFVVSIEDNKSRISFENVKFIFDANSPDTVLTIINESGTYSFNEYGEVTLIQN